MFWKKKIESAPKPLPDGLTQADLYVIVDAWHRSGIHSSPGAAALLIWDAVKPIAQRGLLAENAQLRLMLSEYPEHEPDDPARSHSNPD